MLSRDPVVQELRRRLVAKRGVAAAPIVKDFDVREEIGNRFVPRFVARAVYAFVLQAVEETFARSVVPAISFPAHRADHSVLGQLLLKRMTSVLAAPIGVVNVSISRRRDRWFQGA